MLPNRRLRSGFTLLETLFAVLIVAILGALALPMYANTRKSAAKSACMNNVRAIANAETKYKFEIGGYLTGTGAAGLDTLTQGYGLAAVPTCPSSDSSGTAYNYKVVAVTTVSGVVTAATVSCLNTTDHSANTMSLK